jgi:hypothetical protein
MTLRNYAYYSVDTGFIENVVLIDDAIIDSLPDFPAQGFAIIEIPEEGISGEWNMCGIGWSYVDGQFVEPPKPEVPAQPVSTGTQTL